MDIRKWTVENWALVIQFGLLFIAAYSAWNSHKSSNFLISGTISAISGTVYQIAIDKPAVRANASFMARLAQR